MQKKSQSSEQKTVSRRTFLQMTGAIGSVTLLAACTPTTAPQTADEAGESGAVETVTISWWNQYSTATTQEVIPQIIEGYEELYPNVTVEYEISGGPPGGGDYTEVLLTRIAAGNPPNTATLWDPPVQFAARGSLTVLDDYMENAQWATPDAFFEGPLNSCRWQGDVYGLPASAGAGCIIYNVEQFGEMGLPTSREEFPATWEEMATLSEQITAWEGGELQRASLVPWATPWLKPVWSGLNGGQLFDADNNQYVIDSAENIEWVNYWLQWLDEQFQGDVEELNLYGEYADAYPGGAFNLGLMSMVQSGSWACNDAEIPFEWEVAPFPVGPDGSTSRTGFWPNWWIMPAGVSNPLESFQFCEYFCTKGWEIWYTGIMDTPAWKDFPEGVLSQGLVDQVGVERAQEIHNFFADYLTNAVDMWNSPVESFASDTLDAAIDEVLHKTKSPADALAESQELIQARLDDVLESA